MGPGGFYQANKNGKLLLNLTQELGLVASNLLDLATGPVQTHVGNVGQSTLDYVFVSGELVNRVRRCHTIADHVLNNSDHRAVSVSLDIKDCKRVKYGDAGEGVNRWDKLSSDQINDKYAVPLQPELEKVIQFLDNPNVSIDDIDCAIERINTALRSAARSIPKSRYRAHLKPYWNEELTKLKRTKVIKFRICVNEGRPRDANSISWAEHKDAKKKFQKELKRLSKSYENEQVLQAVNAANVDRGVFWRLVKKSRKGVSNRTTAIRDKNDKVVNSIPEALEVWRSHFEKLGTPVDSNFYDKEHFDMVTKTVNELNRGDEIGDFLDTPFSREEVAKAIGKLHKRKACGIDGISTEHIVYAGNRMITLLTLLYNHLIRLEYVPVNMRRGIQVPLFKGKGACCLDVNSYKGISLLTNYNKAYEILLWDRVSKWWSDNKLISDLQGAGKKGQSCFHSALVLQEAISAAQEGDHKVFVAFFDVSKAYDTVWTDGLFFQLHKMGIRGKLWRMIYRAYVDFRCKVRLGNKYSNWYTLKCSIQQGGFLSLTKYVAFINSLLVELEASKLCCPDPQNSQRHRQVTPTILAAACINKLRIDKVMKIVNNYGRKWHFHFNAKKSAVLVYGEDPKERKVGSLQSLLCTW